MLTIPIEISARHIHLSPANLAILFGDGYKLTPIKELSQREQFACEEVVEIQTPATWGLPPHRDFTFGKACDHNQIRILGPVREHTQLELSWTDCITLELEPHVVISGDYAKSSSGLIIVGPQGEIVLNKGIIVPQRHIHCNTGKAKELGLSHGQNVSVRVTDDGTGKEPLHTVTFHHVVVRTHETFDWQMHLTTDEGNAAGIHMHGVGEVLIE